MEIVNSLRQPILTNCMTMSASGGQPRRSATDDHAIDNCQIILQCDGPLAMSRLSTSCRGSCRPTRIPESVPPLPFAAHNDSVAPRKPIDATAFSTTDARCCRAACLLDLRQVRQRRQCGRKPAQHRHESALGHQDAGVQSDCRLDGPPAHPGSLADGVVWLIRPSSPASAGRGRSIRPVYVVRDPCCLDRGRAISDEPRSPRAS